MAIWESDVPSNYAIIFLAGLLIGSSSTAMSKDYIIDDFKTQPETRWKFIADTVMGGVSTGDLSFHASNENSYARMTGTVSTRNNGGFIQFRTKFPSPLPNTARGLRFIVRGNDQRYFLHLRTGGTLLPWQYYQSGFDAKREWSEVRVPFGDFKPSGVLLRAVPRPEGVKSLGFVAFGRNHEAEIEVLEVGYF